MLTANRFLFYLYQAPIRVIARESVSAANGANASTGAGTGNLAATRNNRLRRDLNGRAAGPRKRNLQGIVKQAPPHDVHPQAKEPVHNTQGVVQPPTRMVNPRINHRCLGLGPTKSYLFAQLVARVAGSNGSRGSSSSSSSNGDTCSGSNPSAGASNNRTGSNTHQIDFDGALDVRGFSDALNEMYEFSQKVERLLQQVSKGSVRSSDGRVGYYAAVV